MTGNLGREKLIATFGETSAECWIVGTGVVEMPLIAEVVQFAEDESGNLTDKARTLRQLAFLGNVLNDLLTASVALVRAVAAATIVGAPASEVADAVLEAVSAAWGVTSNILEATAVGLDASAGRLCSRASELVVKLEAKLPEQCPVGCQENEYFGVVAACAVTSDFIDYGDPNCTYTPQGGCDGVDFNGGNGQ
jgi:hypothetical protein